MALERERKFLVDPALLPLEATRKGVSIQAGYFTQGPVAIRVTSRLGNDVSKQKICFKGPGSEERQEFEYTIPNADAEALLALSPTNLFKLRYEYQGWEIDCIDLPSEARSPKRLWVAEWEEAEGKPSIPSPLPDWIIEEVTHRPEEFSNAALAWKYGRKAA